MIRRGHRPHGPRQARYAHRLRVAEAAVVLAVVVLLLALLPFRLAIRLVGLGAVMPSGAVPGGAVPGGAAADGAAAAGECPPPTADGTAAAVGRAVTAAARRLPWHPLCLEQALAAALMLRRRGVPSRLCLGVAVAGTKGSAGGVSGGGFRAHAWLTVADGTVCGGAAAAGFTPIVAFRSMSWPSHVPAVPCPGRSMPRP